jgi:hypothetical protein
VHIVDSFHLFTFIACLYDELSILMLSFVCLEAPLLCGGHGQVAMKDLCAGPSR